MQRVSAVDHEEQMAFLDCANWILFPDTVPGQAQHHHPDSSGLKGGRGVLKQGHSQPQLTPGSREPYRSVRSIIGHPSPDFVFHDLHILRQGQRREMRPHNAGHVVAPREHYGE